MKRLRRNKPLIKRFDWKVDMPGLSKLTVLRDSYFDSPIDTTPERNLLAAFLFRMVKDLEPIVKDSDREAAIRWFQDIGGGPKTRDKFTFDDVIEHLELEPKQVLFLIQLSEKAKEVKHDDKPKKERVKGRIRSSTLAKRTRMPKCKKDSTVLRKRRNLGCPMWGRVTRLAH